MARKLQIKRGAKADLPILSQGEFGMVTDSGAEELHLGTGSKNIHVPTVGVYYDDMNALVRSGIFRVGTNTNLDEALWYGQVLVMQGADSDTVCQIGMGYTSAQIVARAGQKVNGVWTFTEWAEQGAGGDFVSKAGDSMTGELSIRNRNDYVGMSKVRDINSTAYIYDFAVGNDASKGASGSLRFTNDAGTVLGRLDMWANGEITHKVGSGGYVPLSRMQIVSYAGASLNGSASSACSVTFDFAPKVAIMLGFYGGGVYKAFPFFGKTSGLNFTAVVQTALLSTSWSGESSRLGFAMGSSNGSVKKSADGKTITWWTYGGTDVQFNASGNTYYVLGIG